MLPRFIDSTALLSRWTVQKVNYVDRTHLVLLDGATENLILQRYGQADHKSTHQALVQQESFDRDSLLRDPLGGFSRRKRHREQPGKKTSMH